MRDHVDKEQFEEEVKNIDSKFERLEEKIRKTDIPEDLESTPPSLPVVQE